MAELKVGRRAERLAGGRGRGGRRPALRSAVNVARLLGRTRVRDQGGQPEVRARFRYVEERLAGARPDALPVDDGRDGRSLAGSQGAKSGSDSAGSGRPDSAVRLATSARLVSALPSPSTPSPTASATTSRRSASSQIADDEGGSACLVDPLVLKDLSPLAPVMADAAVVKVPPRRRLRRDHPQARLRLPLRAACSTR